MAKSFVLPFVLYLVGTNLAGYADDWYPLAYASVVVIAGAATWWLLRGRRLIVPHRQVAVAAAVGLVGIVLWIILSELQLEQQVASYLPKWLQPEPRASFNPFAELAHPLAVWGFIAVRLVGLALLVPVVEELFWRGFLLRWFISPDWEQVPLGTYQPTSFWLVTLLFTLAHPEWLAAAGYGMLLNGLMYWKRNLWDCIVAHGVSNFVLGVWVVATGSWRLW